MEYTILNEVYAENLVINVNLLTKQGWIPLGAPFATVQTVSQHEALSFDEVEYHQALTKDIKK